MCGGVGGFLIKLAGVERPGIGIKPGIKVADRHVAEAGSPDSDPLRFEANAHHIEFVRGHVQDLRHERIAGGAIGFSQHPAERGHLTDHGLGGGSAPNAWGLMNQRAHGIALNAESAFSNEAGT